MFVDDERKNKTYRGYSPEFVKRVLAKRKLERQEAEMRETRQKKQKERAAAEAKARASLSGILSQYREIAVKPGRRSVRLIILETALRHGASPEDILGPSRVKVIVAARHEAIWRARQERPDMSLPQIGRAFANRDHTTILHAVRKIDAQRAAEGMPS